MMTWAILLVMGGESMWAVVAQGERAETNS